MGYYCTVPQCTSLAGKTKNVKFHRFPRDVTMADKWNVILKRGKPYTKYSKVCSLHFTQADYNVTTMGQWKTLSKEAVPSQNLPRLNPDGSVMVIRKSRTVKYRETRKDSSDKSDKWLLPSHTVPVGVPEVNTDHESNNCYRSLQTLSAVASSLAPQLPLNLPISVPHLPQKPKKQDAFMQTDPVQSEEDDTQPNNSYSETSDNSFNSELEPYPYQKDVSPYPKDTSPYAKDASPYPKDNSPCVSPYNPKCVSPYTKVDSPYPKSVSPYPKDVSPYPKDVSPYPKDVSTYQKDVSPYPKDVSQYQKEVSQYQKDSASQYKDQEYAKFQKEKEYPQYQKDTRFDNKKTESPKDYTKQDDYIPQTNEEYNKEAEKYALERKSHNGYDKIDTGYQKSIPEYQKTDYQKIPDTYQKLPESFPKLPESFPKLPDMYFSENEYQSRSEYIGYQNGYPDSIESLRNKQHNLEMLQQTHRITENQNFFNESHIKQEVDMNSEEEKFLYERTKDQLVADANSMYNPSSTQQRLLEHLQQAVKQEPETSVCDSVMQPQGSPYYPNGHNNGTAAGFYEQLSRPGPEMLIAKQNALAAHTQLWQNTMKRPFFYTETPHFAAPQLLHRHTEDYNRVLQ